MAPVRQVVPQTAQGERHPQMNLKVGISLTHLASWFILSLSTRILLTKYARHKSNLSVHREKKYLKPFTAYYQ